MLSLHIIESSFFPNSLMLDNCAAQLRSHLHVFKMLCGRKTSYSERDNKNNRSESHLCDNTWHDNESMTTSGTLSC